jgi:tRNA (adenine37-N6)-methyltransferase
MFAVRPIGFARSPFREKADAPRQAALSPDAAARIEILPEHERALDDLDGFDRIWVIFWFDRAEGRGASKVLPPRSRKKRGVFATRSPHRPNPIGLSAVRLDRVDGLVLHVRGVDFIDGTPVLDIKPYIPYADAFPEAKVGWLGPSPPEPEWQVELTGLAEEQLEWIASRTDIDLRKRIVSTLSLGPQPHPYRRIRRAEGGFVLAVKEWRISFRLHGRAAVVERIASGYRAKELANGTTSTHEVHRAFTARFPSAAHASTSEP